MQHFDYKPFHASRVALIRSEQPIIVFVDFDTAFQKQMPANETCLRLRIAGKICNLRLVNEKCRDKDGIPVSEHGIKIELADNITLTLPPNEAGVFYNYRSRRYYYTKKPGAF